MKQNRTLLRRVRGQSLVETMAAFFVIIPIGLAGLDLAIFVSSSRQNEQLAETATRAAATQTSQMSALNAAQDVVDRTGKSNVITNISLDQVNYDLGAGVVSVSTLMQVKLPVPLPYLSEVTCRAGSIEPIVSIPAPR